MPLIARQRSRLVVLAVLALVGSLLAVSAVPAVAAGDDEPSQKATASACVNAATEDAGFDDTAGNFAEDAINCLAHYGIALGTSEGVFSPNAGITRAQMALFIVRAAGVAGADLDDPEDQDLSDIGNWTDTIQDAINQAVGAGMMSGSDGAFNPTGSVSRMDMAVILRAFIDVVNGDKYYSVSEDDQDTPFSDLGAVPLAAYNAVNELYELGIAAGTGDGSTFSPNMLVTRAQMARFVTNALGHTNARPAGVSVQVKATGETGGDHPVEISVRDENHEPVADAVVDVFWSSNPDEAWNDDGTCKGNKNVEGGGSDACVIDDDDYATDPEGNITDTASIQLPGDPGSVTAWAWTGNIDDEFDIDETDFVTFDVQAELPASVAAWSSDMKKHAQVLKFGDTVTFTLQLQNSMKEPVGSEGAVLMVEATEEDTSDDPDGAADNGELRSSIKTTPSTEKTDATGRIELSYTAVDPDADEDNQDEVTLTLTLTAGDSMPALSTDLDEDTNEDGIQIIVMWVDTDSEPTTLALAQSVEYHEADSDGARNTVTATLVDQYGDPVTSKQVGFWSSDSDTSATGRLISASQGDPQIRSTGRRSGVATMSYARSGAAGTETISAVFVRGECNDEATDIDPDTAGDQPCAETAGAEGADLLADTDAETSGNQGLAHYWAASAVPAAGAADTELAAAPIRVVDKNNNVLVVEDATAGVVWLTYKADDFLTIVGGDNAGRTSLEVFEGELTVGDTVAASIGDDADDRNSITVTNV